MLKLLFRHLLRSSLKLKAFVLLFNFDHIPIQQSGATELFSRQYVVKKSEEIELRKLQEKNKK